MRVFLLIGSAAVTLVAAKGRTHVVTQKDKQFSSAALTVAKGDSVVFRNEDGVVHNVFSSDPNFKFNLRAQAPGTTNAVAFDTPGTVQVRCAIHPTMHMAVTVTP
jgi:plastocyanin